MENSGASDENIEFASNGHLLSSGSFKGSEIIGNESVFYEKFLLDDLDNYWDELNDRLTVSRMVSDSVIKGMVRAVVEESAEEIALKDEEISILNQKLQACDGCSSIGNLPRSFGSSAKANELNYSEDISKLRLAAEEQLRKLKDDIHCVKYSNSNGRQTSMSIDVGLCSILPHAKTDEKLRDTEERVDSLRKIVDELFKEINTMLYSVNGSVLQQQLEHEYEREISALVIQSSVRGLHNEFEEKLHEQRSCVNTLNISWQQKFSKLCTMREELDAIFRSLSSSDSGPLLSHNSLDSSEESNSKRKDQFSQKMLPNHHYNIAEENGISLPNQSEDCESMLEVADSSQLKHLNRDELVAYYKTEMLKMRRQHESALHLKTEELFRLKREFLREKGSSLFKKDREFELLKKRIPEVIVKLDDILLEKESLPVVEIDHEELCSLKDRIDSLLSDNQNLRNLLEKQREEIKNLSSQISDAASQMSHHSSAEVQLLLQIKNLNEDLLDMKAETSIRDELHGVILKEIISVSNCSMEELEISALIFQDIYINVVRGLITDGISSVNSTISNCFSEKSSLQALINEKEKALCREIEEKKTIKQTITSLLSQIKENEKYASETRSSLIQQKEQFDLLDQETKMLRDQVAKQEALNSSNKIESYSTKRILDEALQQIRETETEIKESNGKLAIALNALKEAEEQNSALHGIIQDKDKELLSCIEKEKQQAKGMESIAASLTWLSKAFMGLENKLADDIRRNETRLKRLNRQWRPLLQQTNLLTKRAILYKQMLELRSSNLQKAEAEVDLLGDEVDALLSLLGKIYIALDHYSPVLQHYPGVMEILKLVQRELEGETTRSM